MFILELRGEISLYRKHMIMSGRGVVSPRKIRVQFPKVVEVCWVTITDYPTSSPPDFHSHGQKLVGPFKARHTLGMAGWLCSFVRKVVASGRSHSEHGEMTQILPLTFQYLSGSELWTCSSLSTLGSCLRPVVSQGETHIK